MGDAARRQRGLEVRGLSMAWDSELVVEDVSFDVADGELVCLLGRSGTGKTTLFHGLAGLAVPKAGSVVLDGTDITGRAGSVAYMLQKDLLLPQRTIRDNVCLPLLVAGTPKAEARARAEGELASFGLESVALSYPDELSGGMRQRVALLRTLLMSGRALLMDEPFSALDALTRRSVQEWFLEVLAGEQVPAVLVTHDVDEAIVLGDRVLVIAGAPAKGVASRVVASFDVERGGAERYDFLLSEPALALKRQILAALDG